MKVGDLVKHSNGWLGIIVDRWASKVLEELEITTQWNDVDWITVRWASSECNVETDWLEGDWVGFMEVLND